MSQRDRARHARLLETVHVDLRRYHHPLRDYFVLVVGTQVTTRTYGLYEERHEVPDDIRSVSDFIEHRDRFEPGIWEDVSNVRIYLCRH
jgi:hypothetical protein